MSNELTPEVDGFISRVLPEAKKQLQFIQENDWSTLTNVKKRENMYKIQHLLIDRSIKSAVELYKMAAEDIKKKRVQVALQTLQTFFTTLRDRYESMVKKFDWTTFDASDDTETDKAAAEVAFQSKVLDDVNAHEKALKSINFGEEDDKVNIRFFDEKPAPFLMRETLEVVYPEIKEYLKKSESPKK